MYKIGFLFILFGLYAILFPNGLVNNMMDSYTVNYLLQGWGIYSVTIGLIILYKKYIKEILFSCFIAGIFWHFYIIKYNGYTDHHIESIIINIIAIIILLFFVGK